MKKERIIAIDVLRGVALLGILLMNIMSYAMPTIAYFNPTVYGGDDVVNRWVFNLTHIFADQKFMAIFSILFGASVMLVTQNIEKRDKSPLRFHYIRNFWLLIFGLVHAILIWDGDILVIYALCSFILYWLRKLPPSVQFILGMLVFYIPIGLALLADASTPALSREGLTYLECYWEPEDTEIEYYLDLFQSDNYAAQVNYRLEVDSAGEVYTDGQALLDFTLLTEFFSRAFGMMLIGMALYTWGIVTGKRSKEFYQRMAAIGLSVGLLMGIISVGLHEANDWDWSYSLFLGRIPNHIGTPFLAAGYIAFVMLWAQSGRATVWQDRFAAVGRTALTNYIGQSVVATFIFYGIGLGLYGEVTRLGQLPIILMIWAAQIALSVWWLGRFRYGLLEWLWRSLSYGKPQPIRRH